METKLPYKRFYLPKLLRRVEGQTFSDAKVTAVRDLADQPEIAAVIGTVQSLDGITDHFYATCAVAPETRDILLTASDSNPLSCTIKLDDESELGFPSIVVNPVEGKEDPVA